MAELAVELPSGIRMMCAFGDGDGRPVVVLLHALGEDASTWDAVHPWFADRFQLLAVSLRGHGASSWPGAYPLESMRDDVLGVLDHLGLEQVLLIGHSLGGVVAYLLAQQQPSRLTGLVVEDIAPPYPRSRVTPTRPPGELGFDWSAVEQIHEQMNDPTMRWWPGLSGITCPTLLIGGGPSSPVPQQLLHDVADRIPDCDLITINTGHDVHETAPEAFSRAALAWLDRLHTRS